MKWLLLGAVLFAFPCVSSAFPRVSSASSCVSSALFRVSPASTCVSSASSCVSSALFRVSPASSCVSSAFPRVSAASQDEPAPVTAPIASWYRLDRKEEGDWRHRGYAREKLSPVGGRSWSYEYTWELTFIFPYGESDLAVGRLFIEAQLRENFDAEKLSASLDVKEKVGRSYKLTTEETRRVLEILTPPDSITRIPISLDDPATPVPTLMLYGAWRTKSLGGKASLRYIDPWAAKPLVLVEAAAAKAAKREILGREVTVIDVELKGAPPIAPTLPAFTKVTLDRFGRTVAAESADGLTRLQLVADEKEAIQADKMLLDFYNRRDPLSKVKPPEKPVIREVVIESVVRLAADPADSLARVGELLKQLQGFVAQGREAEAARVYVDLVGYYRRLWDRLPAVDQAKLAAHRASAEKVWGGINRLVRQAGVWRTVIEDYATALDLKKAQEYQAKLEALASREELWRMDELKAVEKLAREGTAILELCKARIDLEARPLALTGTAVTGDPKTTFCVINDQSLRAGESIGGVRVEKITRDGVTVSLNGATRELHLAK
jgi:hypothetical protein